MDIRELSKLLIKISGLVVIVFAVAGIPGSINGYLYQGQDTPINFISWVLVPLVFPLLIGAVMWFFPGTINNKIIERNKELPISADSLIQVEQIAVCILGLILMFFALSDMTFNLVYVVASNYEDSAKLNTFKVGAANWGHILGTLVEIFFALFLLIKTKGIVLLLKKIRS